MSVANHAMFVTATVIMLLQMPPHPRRSLLNYISIFAHVIHVSGNDRIWTVHDVLVWNVAVVAHIDHLCGGQLVLVRFPTRRAAIIPESQLESEVAPCETKFLGEVSPFFPGILLFRKPSNTHGKQLVSEEHDG